MLVERIYREVRAAAIPGGSEEILLDFAMRQVKYFPHIFLAYSCTLSWRDK
jgi:hypothetical protein